MSIKYGVGIEKEMTFSFSDKNRVARNWHTSGSSEIFSKYYWKEGEGWVRARVNDAMYYQSNDPTVDGGGFEFQTTEQKSINVSPKNIVMGLHQAMVDAAKLVKPSSGNRYDSTQTKFVIPTPYGMPVGVSGGKIGSYHVNLTMPYEDTTINDGNNKQDYHIKLFKGMKVLRAIQPLLMAMVGGADYTSVGNPMRPEGSGRQCFIGYSNLGNTPLDDEFKRKLLQNSGKYYKDDGGSYEPPWREIAKDKYQGNRGGRDTINSSRIGDFVMKKYSNVKVRTMEFRFLDPFFVPNLYEVLKVIVSCLEHGKNVGDIQDGKSSEIWNEETAKLMMEGWNTRISKNYIRFLNTKLGLSLTETEGKRADLVFDEVTKQIWNKNKGGMWVKTMFDEFSIPKVLVLNRYNWDMQFRQKYLEDSGFKDYVNKLLAVLHKVNASSSSQWIKVKSSGNKISVRDLILDDRNFGMEMGTEDFEDMLFLFERANIINIKVNSAGHITAIKMIGTAENSLKKIDNLKSIDGVEETYFGEHVEEIEEQVEVTPPSAISTTETGPISTQALAATETPNIDMNLLQITNRSVQEDSDLFDNLAEIKEVFRIANFLSQNGRPYQVQPFAAKIVYDGRRLTGFWSRQDNRIKLYLDYSTFGRDVEISTLINDLSRGMYSIRSTQVVNNFVPDLNNTDFFGKLKRVALEHYDKLSSDMIKLDKAGMEMLKKQGIRVVSLERGKRYFIADKRKYAGLKRKYKNVKLVKYIPYQKGIVVQKNGSTFNLIQKEQIIDSVRREV